jgi:hypothetical protein
MGRMDGLDGWMGHELSFKAEMSSSTWNQPDMRGGVCCEGLSREWSFGTLFTCAYTHFSILFVWVCVCVCVCVIFNMQMHI